MKKYKVLTFIYSLCMGGLPLAFIFLSPNGGFTIFLAAASIYFFLGSIKAYKKQFKTLTDGK